MNLIRRKISICLLRSQCSEFPEGKSKEQTELQEELGLEQDDKGLMIGIVSRLTDQKGFDLISYVMDELCQDNIQLVVLGTGESSMKICSVILTGNTEIKYRPIFTIPKNCLIRYTAPAMRS